MELHIRTARPDDVDRIVLFNQAMARETEGRELDRGVLRSGVEALLDDPARGAYYVAELRRTDGGGETHGDAAGTVVEDRQGDVAGAGEGADAEAEVVGQLMVTTEWSDWRDAPVWWIQSVYVSRKHRGRGVYRALHREVRRRARDQGAAGLRLYVDRDNRPAHEVYEALGMRRSHYVMYEEMWR